MDALIDFLLTMNGRLMLIVVGMSGVVLLIVSGSIGLFRILDAFADYLMENRNRV